MKSYYMRGLPPFRGGPVLSKNLISGFHKLQRDAAGDCTDHSISFATYSLLHGTPNSTESLDSS